LQRLYHTDKTSSRETVLKDELQRHLTNESAFRTGIEIEHGELFLAVPKQLTVLNERLLRVEGITVLTGRSTRLSSWLKPPQGQEPIQRLQDTGVSKSLLVFILN